MKDKKIIIDSVDVSKCKHFKAWYESRPNGFGGTTVENYCYLYKDNCEKYPQCLYRSNQLQQLETQLKQKEKECEELKKANDGILTTIRILAKNNIKLREILTEIKEIAETFCNARKELEPEKKGRNCMYCNYNKILQKAKEI